MITYLLFGLGTFLITYLSTPLIINLSHRFGFLDHPDTRKKHVSPTPFTGGWVISLCFWIGFYLCICLSPDLQRELSGHLLAIFFGYLLVFAGGVLDDFINLQAVFKLLIQITAASLLYFSGLKVDTILVPFLGAHPLGILSYPATVLWVLMIVNAINIIDGLNGLASGLSIIAAVGLLYTSVVLHITVVAVIMIFIISVLLGFLRYNFPAARIFMGDSGSQSIGFLFAVAAIYCPIKSYTVVAMFIPVLTLGVPLLEFGITFMRRLLTGKSLVHADLGHLFYMLPRRGISKTKTVLIFWGVAATLQVFVFTLFLFDRRVVFSILILFMLLIASWFLFQAKQEER